MKPYVIFLFACLLIIGCNNQNKDTKDDGTTNPDSLSAAQDTVSTPSNMLFMKCWANAFEEEGQDSVRVFRPCATHTFPAARYRNTFTLNQDGTAEYSVMAANDAHTTGQGTWTYDDQSKRLNILNKENGVVHSYEVIEIGEDVLRVKE